MFPRSPPNFRFLGPCILKILPENLLKMVILKYVFMFKVKYEPLRDLRLPPNFTGREGIMSPRCPPKFSNLAPLFLKLLTNKLQKTELLELFGRFEVKYGLLRHLVFKWNLTWCQLKVLTMSCTNFSGLCQLLGEILASCPQNFNFLGPLQAEIWGLELYDPLFLAQKHPFWAP